MVRPQAGAFIDLLFANSGIEDEIVQRADLLEVLPDVFMPVASTGHLIALNALAGRHQDLTDLGYLIAAASDADLDEARTAAAIIEERGAVRRTGPATRPPVPTPPATGVGAAGRRGARLCRLLGRPIGAGTARGRVLLVTARVPG